MIGAIVHQLTRNLKDSQIQDSAFAPYFVDHTTGVFPNAASGALYNTGMMAVKGDPIADLAEDLAADDSSKYRLHFQDVEKSMHSKKLLCRNGFSDFECI